MTDRGNAEPENGDVRRVPLVWVGLDELPVLSVNQIVSQFHQDLFVISLGMLTPPPVMGSVEDRRMLLERINFAPIRPVIRIGLTRDRLEQFINIMKENLDRFDSREAREDGE